MSLWDYMPHRLFINHSLRKEAAALRARIDTYQIEHDRKIKEYQEEINEAKAEKQKKLEQFKESLLDELRGEKKYLEAVAQDIIKYADTSMQLNCLYLMKTYKQKQIDLLYNNKKFLTEQMHLIKEEIDLLNDRQRELISFTKVDDIIQLAFASGCEIDFDKEDDARTFLYKVDKAIEEINDEQGIERFALVSLKGIIQERSEYLPTIKFIKWTIRQKNQFRRELSKKIENVKRNIEAIKQELSTISSKIKEKAILKEELAKKIRYYWAQPITYLNVDIDYSYKENNEIKTEIDEIHKGIREVKNHLKNVNEELDNMASQHMSDQDTWEQLQDERRELKEGKSALIDSLNSKKLESERKRQDIESKKQDREQWYKRRNDIFEVCKKYDIPLLSEKKTEPDENNIIEARLSEIKRIKAIGAIEAERLYEQKRITYSSEYMQNYSGAIMEISRLKKQQDEIESKCKIDESRVRAFENKIKEIENNDNRNFITKLLFNPPGLLEAQKNLEQAKDNLEASQTEKTEVGQHINYLMNREIDKLNFRKLKNEEKRRERGNENKRKN